MKNKTDYETPVLGVVDLVSENVFAASDVPGSSTLENLTKDDWGGSWSY